MSRRRDPMDETFFDLAPEICELKNRFEEVAQGHTTAALVYALAFTLFHGLTEVYKTKPRPATRWSTITKKLATVLYVMAKHIHENQISSPAENQQPQQRWIN